MLLFSRVVTLIQEQEYKKVSQEIFTTIFAEFPGAQRLHVPIVPGSQTHTKKSVLICPQINPKNQISNVSTVIENGGEFVTQLRQFFRGSF